MKLIILVAATLLSSQVWAGERLQLPVDRKMVQSCRAALVVGSFEAYADGIAKTVPSDSPPFWVNVREGAEVNATCIFASGEPPQLQEVYIYGCYECMYAFAPEEIARINGQLRQFWTPTP